MKRLALLIPLAFAGTALAQSSGGEGDRIKWSGFASVVVGKTTSSDKDTPLPNASQIDCPCFVTNWSYNGVYHDAWTAKPDSRAGIQANITVTDKLSVVAQLGTRAAEPAASFQWAYASYQLDQNWQVQVGRKRVPLYYYSEFQDVGFALPWVSPPSELYGWEVNNFNGGVVRYQNSFDDLSVTGTVFYGNEKVKDSKYNDIFANFWGGNKSDVSWEDITGADLEFSKDWWTVRGVYLRSKNHTDVPAIGARYNSEMSVYGLAFNGDFGNFFFLSELTRNDRTYTDGPRYTVRAPAYLVGAGYRYGKWTPFVSVSQYREHTTVPLTSYSTQGWKSKSFTLRYDLDSKSALKAQYNINDDIAPLNDFSDNVRAFRVSYDVVF